MKALWKSTKINREKCENERNWWNNNNWKYAYGYEPGEFQLFGTISCSRNYLCIRNRKIEIYSPHDRSRGEYEQKRNERMIIINWWHGEEKWGGEDNDLILLRHCKRSATTYRSQFAMLLRWNIFGQFAVGPVTYIAVCNCHICIVLTYASYVGMIPWT